MAVTNIFGRDFYQGTDAEMATCTPNVTGALFWTTDTLKLYCYSGGAWNEVGTGAGGSVATDAIWDAKGDLAVGTGANTASKLTVGANGLYLFADSGESTGAKWKSPAFTDWNTKSGNISTSAYAFKGNYYEPSRNIILYAIGYYGTVVASGVYKAMVITVAGGVIASIVGTSESITMNAAMADLATHTIWLRFSPPLYLTAETKYGFIYGRTDDANNYILPIPFSSASSAPFDSEDGNNESIRIEENDPIVGTSVNDYTNNTAMGFQWNYT